MPGHVGYVLLFGFGVGVGVAFFLINAAFFLANAAFIVVAFFFAGAGVPVALGAGACVTAAAATGTADGCAATGFSEGIPGLPSFEFTKVTRTSPSAWLRFSFRKILILSARRMLSFC